MQAVILANNENEHFQRLGRAVAVSMLPLTDRPVISLAVELLAKNGLRNILVALGNGGEAIEGYLGTGRRWGVSFTYARHHEPISSAGVLKRSERQLKETFVIMPADAITMVDLAAALAQHRERKSAMTIVAHACAASYSGARVCHDAAGKVTACGRDISINAPASTGIFILEPGALAAIPAKTDVAQTIEAFLIPALLAQGLSVDVFTADAYWNPLASLADYAAAQHAFLQSAWQASQSTETTVPIPGFRINAAQIAQGVWIGRNHAIHPTARIAAPIYVADNCYVGKDVELGPYAVLGENTIIDDEATVADSTILAGTYVGRLVKVEGRVVNKTIIADPATGEATTVVDAFLLAETRPALTPDVFRRLLDGFFALLVFIVALPFMLLISLVVLITSGGRVIRRLPRVTGYTTEDHEGSLFRSFQLLRFETRRRDGTPTGFGRWLERLDWDRLPELWNIVRGDLRWVGIKPLSLEEAGQLTEEWQTRRFTCPAGVTGLWYVQEGATGQLDEILVADAYYVATRNLREDIRLWWRTPGMWWRRVRKGTG